MNMRIHIFYMLGLLFAIVAPSHAQTLADFLEGLGEDIQLDSSENAGLTAFPTLNVATGGEYLSMATAYTALAHGISYPDANPAGSSWLRETITGISHNNIIADAALENVAFAHRIDDVGFGAAARILHVPFTQYNQFAVQVDSFRYLEVVGVLNTSYNFLRSYRFPGLSVGANIKLAYRHIPASIAANQSSFAIMGDIGLLTGLNLLKFYSSDEPNLTFGAVVKNLGITTLEEPLPSEATFGIAYAPLRQLLVSFDVGIPFSLIEGVPPTAIRFAAGIKSDIVDFLSIQAGFGIRNQNPQFTLGSTVRLSDLELHFNYTFDTTTQFTTIDRFSIQLALHLGDDGRGERKIAIRSLYLDAADAFVRSEYDLAARLAQEVLDRDPRFEPAQELLELAQELRANLDSLESIRVGRDFFSQNLEQFEE